MDGRGFAEVIADTLPLSYSWSKLRASSEAGQTGGLQRSLSFSRGGHFQLPKEVSIMVSVARDKIMVATIAVEGVLLLFIGRPDSMHCRRSKPMIIVCYVVR